MTRKEKAADPGQGNRRLGFVVLTTANIPKYSGVTRFHQTEILPTEAV